MKISTMAASINSKTRPSSSTNLLWTLVGKWQSLLRLSQSLAHLHQTISWRCTRATWRRILDFTTRMSQMPVLRRIWSRWESLLWTFPLWKTSKSSKTGMATARSLRMRSDSFARKLKLKKKKAIWKTYTWWSLKNKLKVSKTNLRRRKLRTKPFMRRTKSCWRRILHLRNLKTWSLCLSRFTQRPCHLLECSSSMQQVVKWATMQLRESFLL